MGTRADFYVGRGENAEWLGSIAWDGHPFSVFEEAPELFVAPAVTADEWRRWVAEYLASRDDGTTPDRGWPWPWEDSNTTDYAYALDDGAVWGICFGYTWFRVDPTAAEFGEPDMEDVTDKEGVFPDMTSRQRVTFGKRSGVITISAPLAGGEQS